MTRAFTYLAISLMAVGIINSCKEEDPEPAPVFSFESVSGLVISDEGVKLLATNVGLCSLDVNQGIYLAMENELGSSALFDLVYSYPNQGKELWGASGQGVYNFTASYLLSSSNSGLQNDQVSQIGFNPAHTGFFASSDGLSLQHGESWSEYTGLDDFFLDYEISDIASASNNYTYVTTYGGGIERFKAGLDGISGATLMDTDWTKLESNYVYSVYIDDTTQVYGTDLGVGFHFSEYTKWDWEVYTTSDGLVNDTVLSVVRDNSDQWWIGTANGISMYDESQWVSYTTEEYDMSGKAAKYLALDTDGSVWMASDNGLSHFTGSTWVSYPKASN